MKLRDMKLSKAQKKETMPMAVSADGGPDYPYGLRITLDSAALDKLGISKLPKVGAKMSLQAVGVITSVSQHESKDHDSRSVEIQLQELGVESDGPMTPAERRASARSGFNALLEEQKRGRRV
jgi:hypothetical protein